MWNSWYSISNNISMGVKQRSHAVSRLARSSHAADAPLVSLWMLISPRNYTQLCLDNKSRTLVHAETTSHRLADDPSHRARRRWTRSRGPKIHEGTQTLGCGENAACKQGEQAHTYTHSIIHTHTHARSVTQSLNSSRADPSIARCLGSNHHSQQGQYERMADRLWRRLSRPRLMTQISWRVLPHRVQHTAKDPSPPYATWKCASDFTLCAVCIRWWQIQFAEAEFLPFNHKEPNAAPVDFVPRG